MILTSCRIICLNKTNRVFKGFDLPLSFISHEKYIQPIFGYNYLLGKCKPLSNIITGDIHFKIWLGYDNFILTCLTMIHACRKNMKIIN